MSEFAFKWLKPGDLPEQQMLEDAVMSRLAEAGRQHFFTPLSQQRKQDILLRGDYIAGLWEGHTLVGQMIVEEAIFPGTFYESYTNDSVDALGLPQTRSYYLRNSLMHPAHQGKRMLEDLFEHIVQELSSEDDYYTVIHPKNSPSIRLGKHIGFEPLGSLTRRKDGQEMNLYKRLSLQSQQRLVA